MYKVDFSLNEWNFTVTFNQEEDYLFYKEQIEQSVIDMNHKQNGREPIIIIYENDKKAYLEKYREMQKRPKEVISSFLDEYYDKYQNTFVSSHENYLIERESQNTFRMICKENLKRHEVIYIIREIYVRLQENKKSLFIHGNGLEFSNHGIMLMGNSGSGKTTFMMKLFEGETPTKYLSNDRIFLTEDDHLAYFPIPLILANGTAHNTNAIFEYLKKQDSLYDSDFTREILLHGSPGEKFALYKQYMEEIFPKCLIVEEEPLDTIIIPKMNFEITGIKVETVENYQKAMETCFTPVDKESKRRPWIMERSLSDSYLLDHSIKRMKEKTEEGMIYQVFYNPNINSHVLQEEIKRKILKKE